MSMNIDSKLNNENNFWDISLQGELDVSTADKLKEHLHNLADEKILDMKINLENLDYIDSTGLGAMIGVLKKLKTDNKEIYIINPKSNVKELMFACGFTSRATFYRNFSEKYGVSPSKFIENQRVEQ